MAKRDELDAMFKAVTDKWGSVDVLVNNAGDAVAGLVGCWCVREALVRAEGRAGDDSGALGPGMELKSA